MQRRPTLRSKLCVTGYRLSGSTGTVFLFGIMVGAVAPLELRALWTGSPRTAATTPDAQLPTWHSPTEPATPDSNTNSEPTKETSKSTELSAKHYPSNRPTWRPTQPFLKVVAAIAALVLAGRIVGVAYKTRAGVGVHGPATPFEALLSGHPASGS